MRGPSLLLFTIACQCVAAVRVRGGASLEAASRERGGALLALPTTTVTCGLRTTHYAAADFDQDAKSIKLGSGGFGVVHARQRADAAGSAASPLEERVLASSRGFLAVKTSAPPDNTRPAAVMAAAMKREAVMGLLVCSGGACPPGSPFAAFVGTVASSNADIPDVASERVMGVPLSAIMDDGPALKGRAPAWEGFLAVHALPEAAAPPVTRNLDGVLAAAAHMALAVARLRELNVVHHDIKPDNAMVTMRCG